VYGVTHPLASYNPVWANFAPIVEIARQMQRAQGGDKVRVWFATRDASPRSRYRPCAKVGPVRPAVVPIDEQVRVRALRHPGPFERRLPIDCRRAAALLHGDPRRARARIDARSWRLDRPAPVGLFPSISHAKPRRSSSSRSFLVLARTGHRGRRRRRLGLVFGMLFALGEPSHTT